MFHAPRFKLAILAIALAALALPPASWSATPRFTSINFPGAVHTYALGINPAGDIVGAYVDSDGNEHGYILRNGTFTRLDFPGASWTEAYGISPLGDIVGQYGLPAPADETLVHGFLLRNGSFYPVDVAGPQERGNPNTMPFRISPNGTIVGCYHQSNPNGSIIMDTMHGFSLSADGLVFNALGSTMHGGVNPAGDVAGHYWDPALKAFRDSYVTRNGVTTWFTVSGSSVTRAWDISATGDVVGTYKDAATNATRGFLLHEGVFTSIHVTLSGATVSQTAVYGINAVGEIVGYYRDQAGFHGFLLSRRGPE